MAAGVVYYREVNAGHGARKWRVASTAVFADLHSGLSICAEGAIP